MEKLATNRGLYAIIDPEHCAGRDPIWVAKEILAGGCAMMQLRAKKLSDGEILALGKDLKALCGASAVPFVLNDRADLAEILQADALHLGQDDLPLPDARSIYGGSIGLSTHSYEQAREASVKAEMIGIGPIFPTQSKINPDPCLGLTELERIARDINVPCIAIGGITVEQAPAVFGTGVQMIAMIRAISMADHPRSAARKVHIEAAK